MSVHTEEVGVEFSYLPHTKLIYHTTRNVSFLLESIQHIYLLNFMVIATHVDEEALVGSLQSFSN